MPYKEKEIEKLYYTIGEVAGMFGVNTSHIRFWSNEFDVIRPATNKKGNRMYTREDIDNFRKIYHLVKEKGYTLRGAKTELKGMKFKDVEEVLIAEDPEQLMQDSVEGALFYSNGPTDRPAAIPSSGKSYDDDFVDRMALRTSLEKMRGSLLELQKEVNVLATA